MTARRDGLCGARASRRQLLQAAATACLAAALMKDGLSQAFASADASPAPPALPQGQPGRGKRVVIIGAGISGLVAAYELGNLGFECTVVEADRRAGGRNFTVRGGTVVSEKGQPDQVCRFDNGLYFNAGPARIASDHQVMLGYLRRFSVPLEVFTNFNVNALFQSADHFGGVPVRLRELDVSLMRHLQNILSAVAPEAFPSAVLPQRLHAQLLAQFRRYSKSSDGLGLGTAEESGDAAAELAELLESRYWEATAYQQYNKYQQPVLLQPVGGMDRIVDAFAQRLGPSIRLGHRVHSLNLTGAGVELVCWDDARATNIRLDADFCIGACPAPILAATSSNMTQGYRRALRSVRFSTGAKIAWQAPRKFWEDGAGIYGGISFIDHPMRQVWYPSGGYHEESGVLGGGYMLNDASQRFARLSLQGRADASRQAVEQLHPGLGGELRHPVSVVWQNQPHCVGVWPKWPSGFDDPDYRRLLEPEGNFYLAGDQISELPGWQEGAALAALRVVRSIAERARAQ